jgi:hypothetical protein
MIVVHAQMIGDQALLHRTEFERLVELARQTEKIEVQMCEDDLPNLSVMGLAEQGGAFDFWKEEGEEVYSLEDGEPV